MGTFFREHFSGTFFWTLFLHPIVLFSHSTLFIDIRIDGKLETFPLALAKADSFDAVTLSDFIFESISMLNVPWDNLLGGSADTTK